MYLGEKEIHMELLSKQVDPGTRQKRLGLWPPVLTQGDRFEEFSGVRCSELCE